MRRFGDVFDAIQTIADDISEETDTNQRDEIPNRVYCKTQDGKAFIIEGIDTNSNDEVIFHITPI